MTAAPSRRDRLDPDALYAAHAPALYRYALRQTGDVDLASDIVQESFMRLLQRPPAQDVAPRAWLFQVATNLVREWGRTAARRAGLLRIIPADAAHSDAAPLPDGDVLALERHAAVHAALARMALRDRTILLMREEGFTHAEIAAAVGSTPKSVGTLVARALTRLTALLAPHWEVP